MANKTQSQRVASTLNRFTDRVFIDTLSARDQTSMSDLIADFFCGADTDTDTNDSEEEEEPGKCITHIYTHTHSKLIRTQQLETSGRQDEGGEEIHWATVLGRSVPQLKTFHHFLFAAEHPGVVMLKELSDSDCCNSFTMLVDAKWCPLARELPPVISPAGLSTAREWYLYTQIREFCRDGTEDRTCPMPSTPLRGYTSPQQEEDADGRAAAPPAKCVRRCGKCGGAGHTRRTCEEN